MQRAISSFFSTSSVRGSSSSIGGESRLDKNENEPLPPALKILSKRFSIGGSGQHDGEGRVIVLELKDIWLVNVCVTHSFIHSHLALEIDGTMTSHYHSYFTYVVLFGAPLTYHPPPPPLGMCQTQVRNLRG